MRQDVNFNCAALTDNNVVAFIYLSTPRNLFLLRFQEKHNFMIFALPIIFSIEIKFRCLSPI